jgi:hypothetical protein
MLKASGWLAGGVASTASDCRKATLQAGGVVASSRIWLARFAQVFPRISLVVRLNQTAGAEGPNRGRSRSFSASAVAAGREGIVEVLEQILFLQQHDYHCHVFLLMEWLTKKPRQVYCSRWINQETANSQQVKCIDKRTSPS